MSRPYYMPSVEEMIDCGLVDPYNNNNREEPTPPPGYEYFQGSLVEIETDECNW